jgi:hypothetical protein
LQQRRQRGLLASCVTHRHDVNIDEAKTKCEKRARNLSGLSN